MCGISGIFTNEMTEEHIQLIRLIVADQFKRGPDCEDVVLIKTNHSQALLGHNRLSIIDLSTNANQPMWDATKRYCITYNGEIYNYLELRKELENEGLIFKTSSDTEVILNAFVHWGIDALNRFLGPFAFVLFDKQLEELWLCRDRFGVKPIFYTKKNNVLYIASTTTVLAKKLNLTPNFSYISQGLNYLVYEDGSESTAYQNLFYLPSSCYLHAKLITGQLSTIIKKYYDLENRIEQKISFYASKKIDDLLEEIDTSLKKAVQIRLRTDVPLAISLSGGLDSSSIASLVCQQHQNTIGFSFSELNNKKTEGPIVHRCAKFLNIKINYVWPTPDEILNAFYKTIEAQDAPFSTLSVVAQYLLYEKVRSSGIKVLLGGQGGDEAFMGYKKFMFFLLKQNIQQKYFFSAAKNLLQIIPMIFSDTHSLKNYWNHRHRYINKHHQINSILQLPDIPILNLSNTKQNLWKRQIQDIIQLSLPTLLRYEDRNSMGNSVESRLPYMDHQLIELGLALPENIKIRNGYGKWPIRKIMQDKIPNEIRLARYKRGFDIPLAAFLKAGLGQTIRSMLHDNKIINKEFLKEPQKINELFSDNQLINRRSAISEAVTLLWLNKVYI